MYITDKMSESICNTLNHCQIISLEEKEYYLYCFDFALDLFCFHVNLLFIGALFSMPWQTLLYILTMTPTKMFAGGAHAPSRISCSIISYSVFGLTLFAAGYLPYTVPASAMYLIFSLLTVILCLLAPVDSPNKRIPKHQRKAYRQRCCTYCLFLIGIHAILNSCGNTKLCFLMLLCLIIIILNQCLGIFINCCHKEEI